ncbi:AAA family ATPase [Kribbella sp. NPDC058245]|uniref:AAA family ATPase n=1 Tax=Kribbella sp. NPDC058245 TaxID=3346399 RepID=UPI0036E71881
MTADNRPVFLQQLRPRHEPRQAATVTAAPGTASAYANRAFTDELEKLASATPGTRNHTLNTCAFNLAQLVHAGHLDQLATYGALYQMATAIGLTPHETTATLASAFRSAPPRAVAELNTDTPDASVYTPPETDDDTGQDPQPPTLFEQFPPLDWHALWEDDSEEEWIIQPILPARRLVALFSAPKVGKSLLLLELAVAISRGEPVLGTTIDRPRRVLYVDFENDPRGDVRTRLIAMHRKPDDLDNLIYLSFPILPGLDTKTGALYLLGLCQLHEAEVVVIDTISRAVQGEENENDTWLGFYRHTGLALKQAGIASIRLDHTGKDPAKGMRGGSAKYGDVDAVWSMTAISDTTLKLECTANRMPITEKVLVLERHADPLRHEVRAHVGQAIVAARHGQVIAHVDELFGPATRVGKGTDISFNAVDKALRAEGKGVSRNTLADALIERDLRFGITTFHYADEEDDR